MQAFVINSTNENRLITATTQYELNTNDVENVQVQIVNKLQFKVCSRIAKQTSASARPRPDIVSVLRPFSLGLG